MSMPNRAAQEPFKATTPALDEFTKQALQSLPP
jgi:hypothetical protein